MEEKELIGIRNEVMAALNTFLSHVRFALTLMMTLLGAGLALVSYSLEHSVIEIRYIAALILCSVALVAFASIKIVRRYYKIYASNYIYSAKVHSIHGAISHPWNEDLLRSQSITDLESPDAVESFIEAKKSTDKHSWVYYRWFIVALGFSGPLIAIICLAVIK